MDRKVLFMKKLDKNIDQLLDLICEIVIGGEKGKEEAGFQLWPFHPMYGRIFFTKVWFRNFYDALKKIQDRGFSDLQLAKVFEAPSQIVQLLWMLDGMKEAGLTRKSRLFIVERLFSLLEIWRKDIFCQGGKNIIWTSGEVISQCRNVLFLSLDNTPSLIKHVAALEGRLWLYAELINFETHPFIHSFQGPYKRNKKILLYRKYFSLRPRFWAFVKNLKMDYLEIFETYNAETKIKLDFFERGIKSAGSYKDNLVSVALKVDGKDIRNIQEIKELCRNLDEVINNGVRNIQKMGRQEMLIKYAAHWFYALDPFYRLLGMKKHLLVPEEVRNNIYKKYTMFNNLWTEIENRRKQSLNLVYKDRVKIFKDVFDPRVG